MPQIINTNIASLTAQRNLDKSQSANQQALSRLSSGLRINSSKDDAAGLAISTRFTSQIKGLGVAIRNVGDGVSLAQTADGALGTMTDNLQRIRELSIQSANATNSDVDREALQAEVTQLVAEISRTGEQTTFNGIKLLDGEFDATFQIGANVGETVSFGISELTADSLGGGKSAGVSALGSSEALDNGDLVINGVVVGASTAADDSASTSNAAASGIAKAAAINKVSDQTGVTATALTNIATGTAQQASTGGANSTSGTLTLNGVDIELATGDVDQAADRSSVVTAINARSAETGVVATDSGTAEGGVTLEAADGRNIALSFSSEGTDNLTAASTGLSSNAVSEGGYTLTSTDGNSPVVVTAGTGSLSNAGLVEGSFSANTAAVNTTSRSSRAEVTSDVGDTGALAATVTGGESVDLTNANFSGATASTTFVVEITGAASSFEDGTATVTLDKDYRGGDLQAFVDDINEDLSGNIAAEAYISDDDKLSFRRTSAEAGDIQLKTITVGAGVPGGDATARAALGLQATDTLGAVTTLDSDTNVSRGGQAGRAALTGTAAVSASITGAADVDFGTANFSGAGNGAQFDLIVADATTASDNGTYTVSVDTDFTNALYSGFQTDPADADRVLAELNADIADAGAGDVIEAKFNDTRTKLVFERKNAETGGSVALDNFVSSGTSAAAQSTAFGFTAGQVSTDGSANSTVGADAKAPGAADAVGGTAIGIDTNSGLINGGYDGVNDDGRFTAFTADSAGTIAAGGAATVAADFTAGAAVVEAGGAIGSLNFADDAASVESGNIADLDFSGGSDDFAFDVVVGGTTANVSVTTDYTGNLAGLVSEIQNDIDVTFSGGEFLVEQDGAGGVRISTTATGAAATFTINDNASAAAGLTATNLLTGTENGVDNNATFTITDGTTAVETVTLDQDYADFDALLADVNTNNIVNNNITASESGTTPSALVFTATGTGNTSEVTIAASTVGAVATNVADGTTTGNAATSFTISDGTTSTAIVLDSDYTDVDGLRDELNSQLAASGSLITAANAGGTLSFTSSALGADSEVTISSLSEAAATAVAQNVTGFADGTDAGTSGNFNLTFNVGGVDTTIDLRGAPTQGGVAYTAAIDGDGNGGGNALAAYINSVSGLDASYNSTTNQFTIGATDGDSDLTLVEGSSSALEYLGLSAGSFENTEAITGTETVAAVSLNALSEGDLKINGVTISSSSAADDTASSSSANSSDKAASGIAIAAAINASADETGVSATVNATVVDGGNSSIGTAARAADGDQGTIYINGFSTNTLSLGSDSEVNRTDAIAAINKISGQTGVTATDAGNFTRLTAADGRNISIAIDNQGTSFSGENIGLSSAVSGIAEADFSVAGNSFETVAETTASTVTLTSAREFNISAGTNGTAGLEGLGLVAGTYGGSEDGQFLADIDISTVEGAEAAILALDNAIATVSSQRADLGAIQNRLESTVGNLTVTAENLTAANSRITDADFAVETAELSRSQVLQQAGISILAQANASSQQVLSLLG
ncbi:MAG: flagellin [Pseudohongiellaceae bacterium]